MSRALNDLKRGDAAHAADVLRLALHYLIRNGWELGGQAIPGERWTPLTDLRHRPLSIDAALHRAWTELNAPWMRRLEAMQAIRDAIGGPRNHPPAIARWERDPGRTSDDVKEIFKAAILSMMAQHKGLAVDVTL